MQTKISEITAVGEFGSPAGNKLLKVKSGTYAGRMIAIYKTSSTEIKYCFSNSPYETWNSLTTIASDSVSPIVDAVMNENGDVYLVYSETNNYLVSIKLTITDAGWDIGSKVYVYNDGITNAPSIAIDSSENLHVSFSLMNGALFDLHVKTSTDDALTWGISPTDVGEIIATSLTMTIPKIMTSDNDLFVVYIADWNSIKERSRTLSETTWTTEYTIISSSNIDTNFDATVLPGGFIGVVYDDSQLSYREFDGSNWSPITILDSSEGFFPQITIINNVPVVLYLSEFATGEFQLMQTNRQTGSFSSPVVMENRAAAFDSLTLYSQSSSSYEDKTTEASNAIAGDLYHSISTSLLSVESDKIYCGSDLKFRFMRMLLSTVGVGGTVTYSYFDGANWKSFTPSGGAFNLDSSDKELLLWDDFDSAPLDWQKNSVNGVSRFWIKIEATASFSTAPIGSQVTSISNLKSISVRR